VIEQIVFSFASPPAARLFVKALVDELEYLAILVDGEAVLVIDGGTEECKPQGQRIRQLARQSGSIPRVRP
jgi:hypothetical protein